MLAALRAFGSSHGLPNRGRWEDTLQKVPDFIRSKEGKQGRIRCTPESGHCGARLACPLCAISGLMHRSKTISLFDHLVGDSQKFRRQVDALGFRSF